MAESKQGYGTTQDNKFNRGGSSGAFESAGGIATAVKDKAKDIAAEAGDMASQARDKAQDWASTAGQKVDHAREAVGGGLESFANQIREKAPHEGMIGSSAESVADSVRAAGEFIREHDLADMGKEMTNLVRRYPVQSLLIGIGIGFLLARSTRSSS